MSFFKKKIQTVEEIKKNSDSHRKANRKRTERLCLGLALEEKELITDAAKAAGMSRTDYILNSVRGTRIVVIRGLPTVLLELSRQGNNLNQVARRLNERSYVNHKRIEETCQSCRCAYEQLVRFVDCWNIKLKKMEEKSNADPESESLER